MRKDEAEILNEQITINCCNIEELLEKKLQNELSFLNIDESILIKPTKDLLGILDDMTDMIDNRLGDIASD